MKYTFVDTCFATHHLQFGYDENDTLWVSGSGPVVGWVNTKVFDETGDAAKAQGWSPSCSTPTATASATTTSSPTSRSTRPRTSGSAQRRLGAYAVMPSPVDGSVWCTARRVRRPSVQRPAASIRKPGLSEIYNVPLPGFGIRGGDIDNNGVVWVSLASGHLGSFDRRKCKGPLNGPKATGDHCPEGWTFYKYPGPGFEGHRRQQRRGELLHLGRSAQHAWSRRERSDIDRQSQ